MEEREKLLIDLRYCDVSIYNKNPEFSCKKHALLIGTDDTISKKGTISQMSVFEWKHLLQEKLHYDRDDITILCVGDTRYDDPTYDNIIKCFQNLKEISKYAEQMIIVYCGNDDENDAMITSDRKLINRSDLNFYFVKQIDIDCSLNYFTNGFHCKNPLNLPYSYDSSNKQWNIIRNNEVVYTSDKIICCQTKELTFQCHINYLKLFNNPKITFETFINQFERLTKSHIILSVNDGLIQKNIKRNNFFCLK